MAASVLLLSSVYKASVFSEINPVPHFFHLKALLWKDIWQSKLEKIAVSVSVAQFLSYSSLCFQIQEHLNNRFA